MKLFAMIFTAMIFSANVSANTAVTWTCVDFTNFDRLDITFDTWSNEQGGFYARKELKYTTDNENGRKVATNFNMTKVLGNKNQIEGTYLVTRWGQSAWLTIDYSELKEMTYYRLNGSVNSAGTCSID